MASSSRTPQSDPAISADEIQARLAAIVATSDDAIVSKDLNGVVKSWNAGAERIFGYTAEEMIGRPILAIIPPERQQEEPQILDRLKRGERVDHFETIRRRKDGQLIDISVTISPIKDSRGVIIGASKVARDITTIKRVVKEREHLLESEQAARLEAERVSRAKDEFLATLSHELRTPLNAILGWATLLRCGTFSPQELNDALETIERNARTQTQLIDELLDMSRIISGKLRLDVQPLDLTRVINDSIETVLPAANAKGIRLTRLIDPASGRAMGDPGRLQQILWNLLTNAVKFTPRGGRVQVVLQRVNSHNEISVSDSGQGIHPDFLPRLFTRFAQADGSTTRQHGGLGLGLAIVRHLVELHGGTVRAESLGEDQGSTFTVCLPLSSVYDQNQSVDDGTPGPVRARAGPDLDLSGVKVLVLDDEPDARELVRRVLEDNRATVLTASSASEALEIIQREHPTIVLSDIGMPGEDGFQFLEKVRLLDESCGGQVPAIALTAFARSEDRQRALLAGFQMHVPKPVEPAELLAVVASVSGIARRRPTQPR